MAVYNEFHPENVSYWCEVTEMNTNEIIFKLTDSQKECHLREAIEFVKRTPKSN